MTDLSFFELNDAYRDVALARDAVSLHCAATRVYLHRLAMAISDAQPSVHAGVACSLPASNAGVAFFVARPGGPALAKLDSELNELAAEKVVFRARSNDGEILLGYLAGWVTRGAFEGRLAHLGYRAAWISRGSLTDPAAIRGLQDQLMVILTILTQIDPFDFLPPFCVPADPTSAPPAELPEASDVFDYRGYPPHEIGPDTLCYSRCRWWPEEGKGVVLERPPRSCWEADHNLRLQAAAPMLFETLQAVAREEPGCRDRVGSTLQAVRDPEWVEWVMHPGQAGECLHPKDVIAGACRLEGES